MREVQQYFSDPRLSTFCLVTDEYVVLSDGSERRLRVWTQDNLCVCVYFPTPLCVVLPLSLPRSIIFTYISNKIFGRVLTLTHDSVTRSVFPNAVLRLPSLSTVTV